VSNTDSTTAREEAGKQLVIMVASVATIALMILIQRAASDPDVVPRTRMRAALFVKSMGERSAFAAGQRGIKVELDGMNPARLYGIAHTIMVNVVHRAESWYEGARHAG
jgi:hypothetical protein